MPDLWNVGYPIVEAREDGTFTVTKHAGTGGLVTVDTVAEQLVYEMGNPNDYITPDVIADFSTIRLAQEGPDRVAVSGIEGRPKTPSSRCRPPTSPATKPPGHLTITGPRALEKANLCADIVWKRLERGGCTFAEEDKVVEIFGGQGVCLPGVATPPDDPAEVVLRLAVRDASAAKVERFGKELAPAGHRRPSGSHRLRRRPPQSPSRSSPTGPPCSPAKRSSSRCTSRWKKFKTGTLTPTPSSRRRARGKLIGGGWNPSGSPLSQFLAAFGG